MLEEGFGSLIFAIIQISVLYELDLEEAIDKSNQRFINMIKNIETNSKVKLKDIGIGKLKSILQK